MFPGLAAVGLPLGRFRCSLPGFGCGGACLLGWASSVLCFTLPGSAAAGLPPGFVLLFPPLPGLACCGARLPGWLSPCPRSPCRGWLLRGLPPGSSSFILPFPGCLAVGLVSWVGSHWVSLPLLYSFRQAIIGTKGLHSLPANSCAHSAIVASDLAMSAPKQWTVSERG